MKKFMLILVVVSMVFAIAGCGLWDGPFGDPRPYIIGEWTFDEDSDTTVVDSSGWCQDGTVVKGQWVGGVPRFSGLALKIEELDNAVEIRFGSHLEPTGSFTIEGWINPSEDLVIDGAGNVYPIVVADNVYALTWDSSKGLAFTIYQENGEDLVYTADKLDKEDLVIEKDTWTHVAVTMEANFYRINLYVNAVNVGSFIDETIRRDDLWNTRGDRVYLGKSRDGDLFLGCLDNVRIYSIVVSQNWLGYYADDRWFRIIWG